MAKCPKCGITTSLMRTLFLSNKKTLKCQKCYTCLTIDKKTMQPFLIAFGVIGVLIGWVTALSRYEVVMVIVFFAWITIGPIVYSYFLKLKITGTDNE